VEQVEQVEKWRSGASGASGDQKKTRFTAGFFGLVGYEYRKNNSSA